MLSSFFRPASVALVGASRDPAKLGHLVLKNILDGGFRGSVYPVNPKGGEVLGLPCRADIASLPGPAELAVIVIPAPHVLEVVRQCGERGTKAVIVISAGFKEAGERGRVLELELVEACRRHGMRLIGPNCLGLMDTASGLNASFAFEMPPRGSIAFISQSGALGTAVLDWASKEGVGLSKFMSVGNMADVSESDLIEMLGDDPDTRVVLVYLEGIRDGRRFLDVCRRVTKKKPVIVVKSGVSASGLKAVSSHTGSLAGSDRAFDAACRQCGVLRVFSVQDLFDYALLFAYQPLLKRDRLAIVTNAGGPAVMAVDAAERLGLTMAVLSEGTKNALRDFLPPAGSTANPVDVLGDCLAAPYGKALDTVIADPDVGGLMAILSPQVVTEIRETAEEVVRVARTSGKPVVGCFMGGQRMQAAATCFSRNLVPNYAFPERAVSALHGMVRHLEWTRRPEGTGPGPVPGKDRAREVFDRAAGASTIGDVEGRRILAAYGIRTIASTLATSAQECAEIAGRVGFPLVMKLVSPDILHKTEAGGVRVGVQDAKEAGRVFGEIVAAAKAFRSDARIEGVQLQEQLTRAAEVIIGVSRDPQFGHLLMFGLGGVFVEAMKDVSFRVAPLTDLDADAMIDETRGSAVLRGFRGLPPADIGAVKDVLMRVSALCVDFPEISEMDINPLMVLERGKGAVAVDVRFGVERTGPKAGGQA